MRRLAVVSGKYGGFRAMLPMLRLFDADPKWDMVVYLCDQHFWQTHGYTATDARTLVRESHCLVSANTLKSIPSSRRVHDLYGSIRKLVSIWDGRNRPDAVVVYGDRLEALLATSMAQEIGIPVAHLQAGDRSGGTDDARRWAISALSKWLFCSSQAAIARVTDRWMPGQQAFVVGDHHIDAVLDARAAWDNSIAESMHKPYYVVHMHPDTLATPEENRRICTEMWDSLVYAPHAPYRNFAVLPPCNDRMWEVVDACIPTTENVHRFKHLPLEQYIPLLRSSCGLAGNSSALYLDAPALNVPCFEFGNRQQGRDHGPFGDGTAGKQTYEILCEQVC